MRTTPRHVRQFLVGAAWAAVAAALTAAVVFDRRLVSIGRADLATFAPETWIVLAGLASSLVVGSALCARRPGHPAGWCFLGLATSMALAGAIDGYATWGAVARPGALPGAAFAAHLGDVTFVPWLLAVALVLHVTPTGRPLSTRWARVARATAVAAAIAFGTALVSDRELAPPFTEVRNPLAFEPLGPVLGIAGGLATLALGIGLVASAASLVARFRRAEGTERAQLHWMYLAAAPLPLFVPAAFVAGWTGHDAALLVATGGFVVAVPVAAGLAISRYHLYDVDRILSRTLTYVLLSAVVALTYGATVVGAGRALSGLADSSTVAAVVATLVAVSVAGPARADIQDRLDRRFNRRRFEAVRAVTSALRGGAVDVEEVLRAGVGDPSLRVAFATGDDTWTTADGTAFAPGDTAAAVEARRGGKPVAVVTFDPDAVERGVLAAAVDAATTELDNARLRAEISRRLVEVTESRARLASAQSRERRRLERNLHDGAQQRLLALAMNLRAAQVNGDVDQLRAAVAAGVDQAQATVAELRDLANGLVPAVLGDGGLGAALDDLASRSPVPLDVHAGDARFDPEVESCAWFVVCEAVTNAQKHADASRIRVDVAADDGWLTLRVADDGRGGADRLGSGLLGIEDRANAAGGSLRVADAPAGGTVVTARLPCGS